jgi:hypothetical protein
MVSLRHRIGVSRCLLVISCCLGLFVPVGIWKIYAQTSPCGYPPLDQTQGGTYRWPHNTTIYYSVGVNSTITGTERTQILNAIQQWDAVRSN